MRNSRSAHFGILLLAVITARAYAEQPVIDMHVHTKNVVQAGPEHAENLATMYAYEAEADENNVVLFAASGAQDFVESWSSYFGDRMLGGATFPCVNGVTNSEGATDGRRPCFSSGGAFPDPEWLRTQYERGQLKVMGELGMQYAGIAFNDERMAPYYRMAQELGIPVAFHTSGGPPRTAERCCPGFRLSIGDPEQLEEVLVRYPGLRVQVMHGNVLTYPGLLRMLQQYPNVYVDLTPFSSILPREGFHQMLRSYRMHGLLDRIMFATDDFPVAETITAFQSADFLTEEELGGILCGNAERFLNTEGVCEAL
jgi:hypothetical protein